MAGQLSKGDIMILFKNKAVEFIDSLKLHLNSKRDKADKRYTFFVYAIKYVPIFLIFCLFDGGLSKILFMVLWWFIATMFFDHRDIVVFKPGIRIWFGVPGSGKTSIAAWLTKQSIKHHFKVLSNVQIDGAYILNENDLGKYDMSFDDDGCHVIYDESTINGLDNRNFKEFAKTQKPRYFSILRHMHNMCDVFSQDYDVDLKVKGRADRMFYLKRLPINGFVMYKRIRKILFIRKDDKQFVDGYEFIGLPRICFTRSVWGSFDTLDKSLCPTEQKVWELW